jgi:predicted esterase
MDEEFDACVVGGFSQGGVISLLTALSVCEKTLAGVVSCSGYAVQFSPTRSIPTFLYHGGSDQVI